MKRSVLALLLATAALLGGCGIFGGNDKDETVGWSANKLYGEAKDAMAQKSWDKAIKYLEKLEARYPYGRFAQQAQIDIAYAYWKNGDRDQACTTLTNSAKSARCPSTSAVPLTT